MARSSKGVLRALESVGVKFDLSGMENLRSFDGPCVLVSNHMSTLETLCFPGIILPFKRVTFVVKESLLRYPVFKHIMRAMKAIGVNRRNPREDLRAVLANGGRMLEDGMSVVVFPQTTRTTEFDPSDFNSLGVKLARRAGVPVVPVAVKTDAWGVGPSFMKDVGRIDASKTVRMCFGRPLAVEGRGDAEHGKVVEFIGSRLEEWSSL
ncbi:MAG: lysophospholipid acyltransferase family protein [Nitrospirota bacterium]